MQLTHSKVALAQDSIICLKYHNDLLTSPLAFTPYPSYNSLTHSGPNKCQTIVHQLMLLPSYFQYTL